MDTAVEREVRAIINRGFFSTVFQPIADISSERAIGYESLMRGPENTSMCNPGALFNAPGSLSDELLMLMDHSGIQSSVRTGRNLPGGVKLFINITSRTFELMARNMDEHLGLLRELGIDVRRIVLEISENTDRSQTTDILRNLETVRKAGIDMALDDIGIRSPYLYQLLMLHPAYLKVDRVFIKDLHKDARKQDLVGSMNLMAKKMHSSLIAEGVETADELSVLKQIGVKYAQGYYLGYPAPAEAWKDHGKLAYKLNCWEFLNCGRQEGGARASLGVCPAYAAHGRKCAGVTGTMCTGRIHGSHAEKLLDCLRCDFYNSDHYDRSSAIGRTLKESYDTSLMEGAGADAQAEGTDGNRQGNA